MGKIIFINILLFILGLVLFIVMAAGIGYAMGTDKHNIEVDLAYIAIVILHLVINARLFRKRERNKSTGRAVSSVLIVGAYVGYLFVYLFIYK